VSLKEMGGRRIDFHYLMNDMIANFDSYQFGRDEYNTVPRLVKTHSKYCEKSFGNNRSIYILRHPGDVMSSYFEYVNSNKHQRSFESISEFIKSDVFGVESWCKHVKTWKDNTDVLVKYEDMKRDAPSVIENIFNKFNIDNIESNIVNEAVKRSSFERLEKIEKRKGRPTQDKFSDDFQFMRKGEIGGWTEKMEEDDINYIYSKLKKEGLGNLYNMK
jgi:hypothetical protein